MKAMNCYFSATCFSKHHSSFFRRSSIQSVLAFKRQCSLSIECQYQARWFTWTVFPSTILSYFIINTTQNDTVHSLSSKKYWTIDRLVTDGQRGNLVIHCYFYFYLSINDSFLLTALFSLWPNLRCAYWGTCTCLLTHVHIWLGDGREFDVDICSCGILSG